MTVNFKTNSGLAITLCLFLTLSAFAQPVSITWSNDGNSYYSIESNEIIRHALPGETKSTFVSKADLTPEGQSAINVRSFTFSGDQSQMLLYTNSVKVWRLETRGDYWLINLKDKKLRKIGKDRPASTLMFAKFSPDGTKVAYVSQQNIYMEDIATSKVTILTSDGNRKFINGTFDWVYEEEFGCRDGFQWSPDGKRIAFWQIDATKIKDYYMVNNTDSSYSKIVPVEYPTMGESPSPTKIGLVDVENGQKTWLKVPGDPQENYLPRIEWKSVSEIFVQQLDRKQQESKLYSCDPATGGCKMIFTEKDKAWIDIYSFAPSGGRTLRHHLIWLNDKKEFLWMSEKDGWQHLYRVASDGSKETLITKGDYDVIDFKGFDEKTNVVYFTASPTNATQQYLYKSTLDGKGTATRVSPTGQDGLHDYSISPGAKFAQHTFSNSNTRQTRELIDLPKNKKLGEKDNISAGIDINPSKKVEFFKIKTEEGVEMDGWMVKPQNFDPSKKYPVVFQVYTEPASQTVVDRFGTGNNNLYVGDMAADGYIYMSLDGRGTPAPKGVAWRKSIYRNIGRINIRDQAMAAKEILKWPYVDPDRIAVWGWSGGGSATLNLMFQYPDIYKTGIAIAAVVNQLTYDNIYQERYMGLPQENLQDIMDGSPITYARNLKGNLLYIHGTGDDNVHYNNAEMLVNELIKHNRQFQFMAYPNRSHGISEGPGTREHLKTLYTNYLKTHCPPGGR